MRRFDCTFRIEGLEEPLLIMFMSLDMAIAEHDLLRVELHARKIPYELVKTGARVSASIVIAGERRTFVGYIHHAEESLAERAVLVCIGATYILKDSHQKTWSNITATAVASQVCQSKNLSYNIKPHKREFRLLNQSGMSDWKFLVYLADKLGYVIYPEGASVQMVPQFESWDDVKNTSKIFSYKRAFQTVNRGGLIRFEVLSGSLPVGNELPSAPFSQGVNPRTLSSVLSSASKKKATKRVDIKTPFSSFTHKTVNDLQEAMWESEAQRERTRYPIKARAQTYGFPSLGPGQAVYLQGLGEDYSGYWFITAIKHHITRDTYECLLELSTDSLGKSAEAPETDTVDLTPKQTKILPVINRLTVKEPSVLPGQVKSFDESTSWTGLTSNLRLPTPIATPSNEFLFAKLLSSRAAQ